MILVDTSIWIDHLKSADATLNSIIAEARLLTHDFVIAELAMGQIAQRAYFFRLLRTFPRAPTVDEADFLTFVDQHGLSATGLGMADAHLLAGLAEQPGAMLWTRDRRLLAHAERIGATCYT